VNTQGPAFFLDRDGVINVDHGHVGSPERFDWIDGVFDTVRTAREYGYRVIVVTNQAGIAKGKYTEEQFLATNEWMMSRFAALGAALTAVYYCPYHPDGVGKYRVTSPMRKPAPGMLLQAARDWNIRLSDSLLLGDQETDIEAGRAAGVRATALFGASAGTATRADAVLSSHPEVIRWIERMGTLHRTGPREQP
jgi:D-glycero-D-manno-heptose 1,7-bisphosphate phosphatase